MANVARVDVDERQDKCCQCESRQTERRGVGKVTLGRLVQTGLKGTAKCLQTEFRVVGGDVRKRVAAIVVRCTLLGVCAVCCVIEGAGAVVVLFETCAALIILLVLWKRDIIMSTTYVGVVMLCCCRHCEV
jgi:hypothetical protein